MVFIRWDSCKHGTILFTFGTGTQKSCARASIVRLRAKVNPELVGLDLVMRHAYACLAKLLLLSSGLNDGKGSSSGRLRVLAEDKIWVFLVCPV